MLYYSQFPNCLYWQNSLIMKSTIFIISLTEEAKFAEYKDQATKVLQSFRIK